MNYEESVRSLLALGRELAAPQQARVQKFGLENISILAADLGNPHRAFPCAHIAGTNGKGSTAAMLESILRAAGLRTGLYTSPHLERINERIRINGENISDEDFAAAWTRVHASIESLMASGKLTAHPTFFECVTAMAFLVFAEQRVDFAIYEVGLGGRLDSTNIVTPEVAIITPIDFDHENFLGHSIEEIAAEKAGIIKPGATVVSSVTRPEARAVIARQCAEMRRAPGRISTKRGAWRNALSSDGCYRAVAISNDSRSKLAIAPPLPGRFQLRNALAAATAARVLSESGVPCRRPGYRARYRQCELARAARAAFRKPRLLSRRRPQSRRRPRTSRILAGEFRRPPNHLVYGAMRDKAVDEIAGVLFPHAHAVILTEPRQPRAISAPCYRK